MTSLQTVYDAFLSKMTEDEWATWIHMDGEEGLEAAKEDWRSLLDAALPRFKFPKVSLEINELSETFVSDLSNIEIQILSQYMKCEWLNRSILSWENVKPLYSEKDFSPANLLDKLNNLLESEKKDAQELERIYYRAINRQPYDYTKLAAQ